VTRAGLRGETAGHVPGAPTYKGLQNITEINWKYRYLKNIGGKGIKLLSCPGRPHVSVQSCQWASKNCQEHTFVAFMISISDRTQHEWNCPQYLLITWHAIEVTREGNTCLPWVIDPTCQLRRLAMLFIHKHNFGSFILLRFTVATYRLQKSILVTG
jgi:hypothetical protein